MDDFLVMFDQKDIWLGRGVVVEVNNNSFKLSSPHTDVIMSGADSMLKNQQGKVSSLRSLLKQLEKMPRGQKVRIKWADEEE